MITGSKKSKASSSQTPRKINLQKFAESRAAELESLHSIVSNRLNNDFRSRRNKRRRTTAFDSHVARKRNRKRPRLVGKGNISSLEAKRKNKDSPLPRCVRRRLELKKNPESGFPTSGDGTKRLRTHVWHAKRFTMTKRWGFYLPLGLQGRGRGSRAVLRWFKQGVLVHDASYDVAVQLEGPEDSLMEILQMVLVPSPSVQSEGFSDSVLYGSTYGTAMLHHDGIPSSQPIAPVTYVWRPHQRSSNCCNGLESVIGSSSCFRQLWLWIHASAFTEGFDALHSACQKLMSERGIAIKCFSLEGQLAKLELFGSKAFQLLQKTVNPVSCILENCQYLKRCSTAKESHDFHKKDAFMLENEEHISPSAILSFTIKDPRILPAKRTTDFPEPDSIINIQEVEANDHVNLTRNLDNNEDLVVPSCSKSEGNEIFCDNKNLWDASSGIDPPEEENVLCMEKHQQRMDLFCLDDPKLSSCRASNSIDPSKMSNKAQCSRSCPIMLLKNNGKNNHSVGEAHAIGLREKHWIACDIGLPYFPSDFPDCNAYLSLKEIEATASRQNAEHLPPAIRPFRIPILPPWDVVHVTFDKLSIRMKEAEILSEENMGEMNSLKNSSYARHDLTSFESCNSFDGIVARTSHMLHDYLNGIYGEHLLLFPRFQNRKSSLIKVMKDKSMMGKGQNGNIKICYGHKLCFVRVLLQTYKEGVFEDGAIVCAPCLSDISIWTSCAGSTEDGLQLPDTAVGSYFKEQTSGKWELQEPEDPKSREYHRWPVGFVTSGFVRGSKKPMAKAFCEAVLLAHLREEQWKESAVNGRRKEIYVLVRNLRSSSYRLALATIVLEQEEEDVGFL